MTIGISLNQLYNLKREENETIQEFNIRFTNILERIPNDVKPPEKTITLHYMDAFDTTFNFMLKEKLIVSLKDAMDKARDMEKHVSSSSKVDLLNPSTTSCSFHTKKDDKASGFMNVDPSLDPM